MTKKHYFLGLFAFVIGLSLFSIASLTTAQTNRIQISTEPGVSDEVVANARLATDSSLRFFKETFNLELHKDIRILIFPNPETYAAMFIRESKVNQKEADRRARTTFGWSIGDHLILQNVGAPFNPNPRRRIYNISHEIVHKFQGQECTDQCSKVMWIYEGVAGVFAARVVELSGNRPLAQQKESWLQEVRKLAKRPELKELISQSDWYKGLDKYGTDPSYSFAALAVSNIIEEKGYEPIFVYFKKLKDSSPEESFKKAFGLDMKGFESEFNASLDKLLSKTGK
jgi:hypothetical protein